MYTWNKNRSILESSKKGLSPFKFIINFGSIVGILKEARKFDQHRYLETTMEAMSFNKKWQINIKIYLDENLIKNKNKHLMGQLI